MTMRRRRAWADQRFDGATLTAGARTISNLLANAPTIDTMTVSRIVGYLDIGLPVLTEIESSHVIDVGIGVSSLEAFTLGETALPDPQQESEYPPRGWLYVATKLSWQFKAASGDQQAQHAIFEFDLGGMRKIDKGVLFLSMEGTLNDGAASTPEVVGRVRSLCLT